MTALGLRWRQANAAPTIRRDHKQWDLVKDLKTDRMSKVLGRMEGKFDVLFGGHIGGGPLGCFACKSCQVVSLLGATPDEVKIWQAFPYKPSFANPMAKRMLRLTGSIDVTC